VEQSTQTNTKILSKIFFLSSLILLILIALPLAGFTNFKNPGLIFVQAFHFSAIYLPLYLCGISYYLSSNTLSPYKLLAINLSFLPFLTLTLAMRLWIFDALSPLEQALKNEITPLYRLLGILIGATLVLTTLALYFWQKPFNPVNPSTNVTENSSAQKKTKTKQPSHHQLHFLKTKVSAILNQPTPYELDNADEVSKPLEVYTPELGKEGEEPLIPDAETLEITEIITEAPKKSTYLTDGFDEYQLSQDGISAIKLEDSLTLDDTMFSDPALQAWRPEPAPTSMNNDDNSVMFSLPTAEESDDFLLPHSNLVPEPLPPSSLKQALNTLTPTPSAVPEKAVVEPLPPPALEPPETLQSPDIDVENSFFETKKLYEEDNLLPTYMKGGNLFSPEEQQALNLMAEEIAESADEEEYMGQLITQANDALGEALTKIETNLHEELLPSNPVAPIDDSNDWVALAENFNRVNTAYHESLKAEQNGTLTQKNKARPISTQRVQTEDDLDEVQPSLTAYSPSKMVLSSDRGYHVPVDTLLDSYTQEPYWEIDDSIEEAGVALENTLKEFKIEATVTAITKGPAITMFELLPASGVKLSRIEGLADNIAFRLAAQSVRIVAPIPGKQAVGVEIPNAVRALVSFAELANDPQMTSREDIIPIVLGKDIGGDNQVIDITKTPHLLIAGATGSGKSVCVNALICSILCTRSPQEVRLLLIDPKVVELKPFNDVPHLLTPVITEAKRALQAIQWINYEMDRRYALLDSLSVRNIAGYNKKVRELNLTTLPLPYIVVVIDEFADLMATGAKELESLIARLAAKSRAAGIHLVLATQRPSVDVITGLIKANFPSRIAFMVAGKMDSRVILDTNGAEQLLGKGDMLFVSSWSPIPMRIQGAFLSDDEVERITDYVKSLGDPDYIDSEIFMDEADGEDEDLTSEDDPLFQEALSIVLSSRKASASYLQRRLKIGYNRAARLIELMEYQGVVGPANGSKAREIL
jgi:DNA segregation ATPase FtsK/SpoIIIE-like protein